MSKSNYMHFISYAPVDNVQKAQEWADLVLTTIHDFVIPQACMGKLTGHGVVSRSMPEVFLDFADRPARGVLTTMLELALERSRYLILICSSEFAKSPYVGVEVDHFRIAGYERDHRDAKFKLPGANLGLRPRGWRRKQSEIPLQRKVIVLVACFGVLMTAMAILFSQFYCIEARGRMKAECSLRIMESAQEGASRPRAEVPVDIKGKLSPPGPNALAHDACKIVDGSFAASEPSGDDDSESLLADLE